MKVGILGGGQLGRMLALAGYPLGLEFRVLDPSPDPPASSLAEWIQGACDDAHVATRFATGLDVVTYEFENLPVAAVRALAQLLPVHPVPEALEKAQDRFLEKTFFHDQGIPTAPFAAVNSLPEIAMGLDRVGLPALIKTRTQGYDGKGQVLLRARHEAEPAWASLGSVPCILEGLVPFERELSVLGVRGRDGQTAFYPLVENQHWKGILRQSLAPAPSRKPTLQAEAERYAGRILNALSYVGVLAIEFFLHDGRLLANEMAPRVHNSGHWSIEGAETSQFENHIRAIIGLPLGSTAPRGFSAMLNLIGAVPAREAILAVPGAHLHLYGKLPFPLRKLGHITLVDAEEARLQARLRQLLTCPELAWLWPGQPWTVR